MPALQGSGAFALNNLLGKNRTGAGEAALRRRVTSITRRSRLGTFDTRGAWPGIRVTAALFAFWGWLLVPRIRAAAAHAVFVLGGRAMVYGSA